MTSPISFQDPFVWFAETLDPLMNLESQFRKQALWRKISSAASATPSAAHQPTSLKYFIPDSSDPASVASSRFFTSPVYKKLIEYFQFIPAQVLSRSCYPAQDQDMRLKILNFFKQRCIHPISSSNSNSSPVTAPVTTSSASTDQGKMFSCPKRFSSLPETEIIAFFQKIEKSVESFFLRHPPAVEHIKLLTVNEFVRMQEVYIRGESLFSNTQAKKDYLERLQRMALERRFFVPDDDAQSTLYLNLEYQGKLVFSTIDRLSKTPSLKSKFEILWNGVAGNEREKLDIFNEVMVPWEFPELHLKSINGIILHGDPGGGKTLFARKTIEALGRPSIDFSTAQKGNRYIYQAAADIQEKFNKSLALAPSCIFIDEITALFPPRDSLGELDLHRTEAIDCFLRNINNLGEKKVLILCTTNFFSRIDPAIVREGRLDKHFEILPMDELGRTELFQKELQHESLDSDVNFAECGRLTQGFTPAAISSLVSKAQRISAELEEPIDQTLLSTLIEEKKKQRLHQIE